MDADLAGDEAVGVLGTGQLTEDQQGTGEVGQGGGDGRPGHPHVEPGHEEQVQHHVHQAAGDDADDADMGRAVGLDLDLQVVGHGEKNGEAGDDPHVLLYQVVVFPGGPQEVRHPVQVEQDQHRQEQGGGDDHEQVLVKVVAGPLHVLLPQGDGQDGGGAGGQQDAQGEHQGHEGQGQVDGGEGVLSHAPGHKHAVHQRVEREDPHGHDGRNGEFEKAAYQVQVHNPLLLRSC